MTLALADRIDAAVLLFETHIHDPSSSLGVLLDAARKLSLVLRSDVLMERKPRHEDDCQTCDRARIENALRAKVLEIIGGVG